MRKHYVTFNSPGTFFAESSTQPIDSWDPVEAAQRARVVEERYNAKPYGFVFTTRLSADPVPDGEGGTLPVQEKEVARSGVHFLTGTVKTVDEVEARGDPKERILLSNMRCNDYPLICVNDNSWRSVQPFNEADVIVDLNGKIVERGDTPERVVYRAKKLAEHRAENEVYLAQHRSA